MSFPKISKRLLCAASFAQKGDFVADIGTDHAYLPIYLYTKGIIRGAVVSDINEGPIRRAKENILGFSCENAVFPILSDGLYRIDQYSPDTVFILGMGGELIVNIISSAEWVKEKKPKLVLQPMTHKELLRSYLFENGFEITDETLVEDGKIYQIIVAKYTGRLTKATCLELFFGKINLQARTELLLSAMKREADVISARLLGKSKAGLDGGDDTALLNQILEYMGE
ncbi:MAG: SAM-dependent methyltransferase [Clostridia bacterium]|nr:SAM-dependent methyltransferase [Clostridia bacterium]